MTEYFYVITLIRLDYADELPLMNQLARLKTMVIQSSHIIGEQWRQGMEQEVSLKNLDLLLKHLFSVVRCQHPFRR